MKIIGAGLAGLLAGVLNENATIFEPMKDCPSHKALLRFRTPDIGEAVGIPFRKVVAQKGIWFEDREMALSPRMISLYSQKVSGQVAHRSICKLEPEVRYMAPEGFQDMLRERCANRIVYEEPVGMAIQGSEVIISTVPMNILAEPLNMRFFLGENVRIAESVRPIYVNTYRIDDSDAFMTNYFPDLRTPMYRASISGDILIIESTQPMDEIDLAEAAWSFGLYIADMDLITANYEQRNGKMIPMDEEIRKAFILTATLKHNIYSLGRFAIWKDILLDDVYKDIGRIKHFINLTQYDKLKGQK